MTGERATMSNGSLAASRVRYQCTMSITVFSEVSLTNFRLLNRLLIWLDHQRHKYTYTWNFLRTFHTNEYKFLRKPCVNLSNHVLESGPILLAFVRRKFGRILDISVRFLCTNIMFTCEFYNILTTDSFVSYRIRRGSGTCKYLKFSYWLSNPFIRWTNCSTPFLFVSIFVRREKHGKV